MTVAFKNDDDDCCMCVSVEQDTHSVYCISIYDAGVETEWNRLTV